MTRTMLNGRPARSLQVLAALVFFMAINVAAQTTSGAQQPQKPYTLEGHEVKLAAPVSFAPGDDKLLAESDKALDALKTYLDDKKVITQLRIESHTEAGGDPAASQTLSERRALVVARRLVEKGVDCKRLIAVGFGATKPVAPDDTPGNRAKNRRLAFFNAALLNRLIGGQPADGGGKVAGDPCRK